MVVFANIVFNSADNLSINSLFATGININLMAASVGLVYSAVFSNMNAIVTPQDVPALVLGQLSLLLADVVKDKAKAGHTLLAAGWISTLLTSSLLMLLGKLHAGGLLRKLPSPVISGFIAAMGATAIRGAVSMLSGVSFHIMWPVKLIPFADWKVWAHLGLGLFGLFSNRYLAAFIKPLITSKRMQSLVSPCCMLSPLLLFYMVLVGKGSVSQDVAYLRSIGWMYPTIQSRPFYTLWQDTWFFNNVEWEALANPQVVTTMVVLAALTALSAMLSILSSQTSVPCASSSRPVGGRVNLDQELSILGTSQLLCGSLGGTVAGFQQVGLSASMYQDGGTHRLAEFSAAGFVVAIFLSGVPVSPYVPKFFLGSIFLNLGVSFCKTHLVDTFGTMSAPSYCSMLIIVFVGLWRGLPEAVAVGLAIQIALMVREAMSVDPVFQVGSTDGGFISHRVRPDDEVARLRWSSAKDSVLGKLEVVRLHGPIFFGNAPELEDGVESFLHNLPSVVHIIVDMTRVTQIDCTGVRALENIVQIAKEAGVKEVAFSGASQVRPELLMGAGGADTGGVRLFHNLNDAVMFYENVLLGEGSDQKLVERCPESLTENEWATVKGASSHTIDLGDGELLNEFGDVVDGLWLLVRGGVVLETMVASAEGERVLKQTTSFVAPSLLGTAPFFLTKERHAFQRRADGEHGAKILWLKQADIDELEKNSPKVHRAFVTRFACQSMALEMVHARWCSGPWD
eukprot:TRINITY_DN31776_c0_g1_i1.p1 TRINITY_DN31776_c0_g1~~TRINITY_DN31776_c0_g1_i1.p1  ORF type:complete len:869 (-),score=115.30 TRINITY_DN31776_c0_g1_i1:26-2242(-)